MKNPIKKHMESDMDFKMFLIVCVVVVAVKTIDSLCSILRIMLKEQNHPRPTDFLPGSKNVCQFFDRKN